MRPYPAFWGILDGEPGRTFWDRSALAVVPFASGSVGQSRPPRWRPLILESLEATRPGSSVRL